jgi:hypothetical protein
MKRIIVSFILVLTCAVTGCASKKTDPVDRYSAYCALLNPLVAKANREQVLRRFGMPSKKEEVAHTEVWQYLKSYGAETNGRAVAAASGNVAGARGQAITLGIYDDVTIIFDRDGKLQSWKADIR